MEIPSWCSCESDRMFAIASLCTWASDGPGNSRTVFFSRDFVTISTAVQYDFSLQFLPHIHNQVLRSCLIPSLRHMSARQECRHCQCHDNHHGHFIITINVISAVTVQISADHTGEAVSRSRFPGPLASVSYPSSDDVIDSRYTVIGTAASVL
jgi:hypothetical protein